jgi:alkanesulfonate monooxygenase SsuD/methylene tetrahydromethanopterin reductase-like flavin-dependent oxidoreductase (luciferase family)
MFEGELGSQRGFQGRHYQPTRLLNSPQSISRPRVPIMIGGGGEQKTLRLVAQYADATNVFGGPEKIHHKYEVLRRHCEAVGRPFDEIERSTLQGVNVSRDGAGGTETTDQVIERFGELGDAGAQHVLFSVRDVWQTDKLELLGTTLLAQLRDA